MAKTAEGYAVSEPELVLREWAKAYGKKEVASYPCYSLDSPPVLEGKLRKLKQDTGIESYLTGFSGGTRYAPVVRYNKVHVCLDSLQLKGRGEELAEAVLKKEIMG